MSPKRSAPSAPVLHVLRPGALTLVQDLGRPGHGASGVPRGGVFDSWAARAANRLVGNPDGAAVLEITLTGPTLELSGIAAIALVGDPFELVLASGSASGQQTGSSSGPTKGPRKGGLQRTELLSPQETTRVAIGGTAAGARAWLAVAGGIDVALVLGSRSTDLAGGFGGFSGRALRAGDLLSCLPAAMTTVRPRRIEPPDAVASGAPVRLRILPGPDERWLAGGSPAALAARELVVAPQSDRRGIRLSGPRLELASFAPLRSQGTLPGAVQIPPSGEPIVLGVDAPVTGGYPWVAQVIEADLSLLARLAPGAAVRFEIVDFAAAEAALAERFRQFEAELAAE